MVYKNRKKESGLGMTRPILSYPILSLLLIMMLPMMQLKAQSYSDACSEIDLLISEPLAPRPSSIETPECFYVEVDIQFAPSEDTFPTTFYAEYFKLRGTLTNGVITDVMHDFSSVTATSDDESSFILTFGNSSNLVDMDSKLTLIIETEPGADFVLNVYASPFHLKDNSGNIITGTECDRFESATSTGVIYEYDPNYMGIPPMPGPNPYNCSASVSSDLDPGLEFFVDVANATYDGQTAELPIKMRNVQALDTITLIRADYKIEMEDVFDNLVIEGANVGDFTTSVEDNIIFGNLTTQSPQDFILDSLEATTVGIILLEAPSDPITGGEAIFDFLYARVLIQDASDFVSGLNHCCKPPGIGDTLQLGTIFPCQEAGSAQVSFGEVQGGGLVMPIYLENLNDPEGSITIDSLLLEVEVTTSGDLELDSLAMVNSLNTFPGCSLSVLTLDIDPANNKASIKVVGMCEIDSEIDNLFSLAFMGTGGCVEAVKITIAEIDPSGFNPECVPLISDNIPLPCWRQKGEIAMWCSPYMPIPDVTICQDFLSAGHATCLDDPLSSECEQEETTDNEGAYSIEAKAYPNKYGLTPLKTDEYGCGISTQDLIKITKHIQSIEMLDEPEEWIAADVNGSETISTFDLIKIRKVVLGTDYDFAVGPWRFIHADHVFDTLPIFPTGYDECITYPDSTTNLDFRAVKIGDVNCSCGGLTNIQDTLEVNVTEVIISGGRKLEFESSEFDSIVGFQFGFDFDSDDWIYQEEIEEDLPYLSSDAIGSTGASTGKLKIAWYDSLATGRSLGSGDKMLSLEFEDQPWVSGGSLLTELALNETDLPALAYKEDGTPMVIRLVKNRGHRLPYPSTNWVEANNILVDVQPNPTTTEVTFNIHSPEHVSANLIVYDTQGRQVHSTSLKLNVGENRYELNEIANWPAGLYWYRLETNTESLSGKTIKK